MSCLLLEKDVKSEAVVFGRLGASEGLLAALWCFDDPCCVAACSSTSLSYSLFLPPSPFCLLSFLLLVLLLLSITAPGQDMFGTESSCKYHQHPPASCVCLSLCTFYVRLSARMRRGNGYGFLFPCISPLLCLFCLHDCHGRRHGGEMWDLPF